MSEPELIGTIRITPAEFQLRWGNGPNWPLEWCGDSVLIDSDGGWCIEASLLRVAGRIYAAEEEWWFWPDEGEV